ncbi:MAG: Si-specific NAD(P)(+) transhydrogenase [Pseudomonadota bacterium]|nr:Si-specific NAD(P)(+) transhydrogenase [Pseudomonadota bacterium]
MKSAHYDVIVIGSGPGGEGAAMKLAKSGCRVAMIERADRTGGSSTHCGTIPSKVLRHAIQVLADYRKNPLFKGVTEHITPDYSALLHNVVKVIDQQVLQLNRYCERNHIRVYHGHASFVDPHKISISSSKQDEKILTADAFVIATGSRPYHPQDIDFDHPRIHDSTSILKLSQTPDSLSIYGAGVIGCEYASIFCNLDVKVNLVNTRDRLLSFLDDEITDALSYHLRDQGTVIRHNEEYARVETQDDAVILHCRSGKKIKTAMLLWANGRTGNSDNMGLRALGIAIDRRGCIDVDENYQTKCGHIYAIGDVIGAPGLASASYDQGRYVAARIADPEVNWQLNREFPTGIYTSPEISSLGKTERELTAENIPYEVGQANFSSIARAQIAGHTVGMLKLLFHRETLELLGIHCFGERASEIIHIGQAVMTRPGNGNTIRYFTETTFNYPTMAEAYRVAALNGLNRNF